MNIIKTRNSKIINRVKKLNIIINEQQKHKHT